jgi:hypothetical protein
MKGEIITPRNVVERAKQVDISSMPKQGNKVVLSKEALFKKLEKEGKVTFDKKLKRYVPVKVNETK